MMPEIRRYTAEEAMLLTQTSKGTPMGEVLRRFWWPIAAIDDLKEKPTYVRVLGEDLVLFRDLRGRLGLIGAYCSHRRANLTLGIAAERGLRCRYHGWLFDTDGKVLETPCEPRDSDLKDRITHPAYPVQELGGMIFAYLGPQPAPLLPRYDFMAAAGPRYQRITGFAQCNWLQVVENGMDPVHASFAHGSTWAGVTPAPIYLDFDETEHGVLYRAIRPTGEPDRFVFREHHLLTPGTSLAPDGYTRNLKGDLNAFNAGSELLPRSARYNTPIDDTHTMVMRVTWKPENSPAEWKTTPLQSPDWKADPVEPFHEYKQMENEPSLGYGWPKTIAGQDATIQESMGAIVERDKENLSQIDGGVILFRNRLLRDIEEVKAGRDPRGVIRDEKRNSLIDIRCFEKFINRAELDRVAGAQMAAE